MTEPRLTVVEHPLIQHKLGYLRDKETPTVHFRKLANEITLLLTYEATKDMPTEDTQVETPLETMLAERISGKKVAVCPVLRAGIGMLDGVLSLVSSARVGFVGMYRDEETLEPVQYYLKLPDDLSERDAIVLDPMLATGHSSCAAIVAVKEAGAQRVVETFEAELGVRAGETTEDGQITFRTVECLGGCGRATVVSVDERYHEFVTPEKVAEIVGGVRAER